MDRAKIYDVLLEKLSDNSLEELVGTAAELLNQHIVVLDTSYKVLASWPHELIGDLYWDAQQKYGYVPEENVRMIFENKYPDATFEGISYVDWGNVNVPRCVATLQYRGKAMGHVSIYHTGKNLSVEEVREACACIEQVLKVFFINNNRIATSNNTVMSAIISRLFLGQSLSANLTEEWARASGSELRGKFLIAAISAQSMHKSIFELLTSRLSSVHKYTASAEIDNYCYILFYNMQNEAAAGGALSRLKDYLVFYNIHCGVSEVFEDLDAVQYYMFQARRAHKCQGDDKHGPLSLYRELRTDIMLDYILANVAPVNFMHELFLKLIADDKQNGTQYYVTLLAYLDCMFDSAAAAAKLNVHRNTLLYRINHIQEQHDCSFSDPDFMRDLLLSSWVFRRFEVVGSDCETAQKPEPKF